MYVYLIMISASTDVLLLEAHGSNYLVSTISLSAKPPNPASSETKPLNLETYFISSNDPFRNRFHVVGPTTKKVLKKKRVLFEKYLGQIVFIYWNLTRLCKSP